jgi:transcriptional regulator with XRE-family HTH domain
MTVGERIRQRRLELKMTMEELGEKIGVQKSAINKYEKDDIDMKASKIKALHDVLGLSYLELLDDEDSEDLQLLTAYNSADSTTRSNVRKILDVQEPKKDTESSVI